MITADKVHVGSDRSGQDDFAQANTANADGVVPMSWKASQCHDANGATGQQL